MAPRDELRGASPNVGNWAHAEHRQHSTVVDQHAKHGSAQNQAETERNTRSLKDAQRRWRPSDGAREPIGLEVEVLFFFARDHVERPAQDWT
ncbi:MAG TPA: hypothetical protein VGI70_06565 [Polyangiales bacterium]